MKGLCEDLLECFGDFGDTEVERQRAKNYKGAMLRDFKNQVKEAYEEGQKNAS